MSQKLGDIVLVEGNNELNVQMVPVTASLYGVVTDSATGLPISGVKVIINGKTTTTNTKGEYSFAGLVPDNYTVEFSKSGYQTVTR